MTTLLIIAAAAGLLIAALVWRYVSTLMLWWPMNMGFYGMIGRTRRYLRHHGWKCFPLEAIPVRFMAVKGAGSVHIHCIPPFEELYHSTLLDKNEARLRFVAMPFVCLAMRDPAANLLDDARKLSVLFMNYKDLREFARLPSAEPALIEEFFKQRGYRFDKPQDDSTATDAAAASPASPSPLPPAPSATAGRRSQDPQQDHEDDPVPADHTGQPAVPARRPRPATPFDPLTHQQKTAAETGAAAPDATHPASAAGANAQPAFRQKLAEAQDLLARQALDPAATAFREALALSPGHATALIGLVSALSQLGLTSEAIAMAQEGVAATPGIAAFHVQLGKLTARQGDWAVSAGHFTAALAIDPALAPAFSGLAQAYGRMNRPAEALAAADAAIALDGKAASLHAQRATILLAGTKDVEAEQAYRQALALEPDYAVALNGLITALMRQHRAEEALTVAREAAAANPLDKRLAARLQQLCQS